VYAGHAGQWAAVECRLLSHAHELGRDCEGSRLCRYNSDATCVDVSVDGRQEKLLVPAAKSSVCVYVCVFQSVCSVRVCLSVDMLFVPPAANRRGNALNSHIP
jgi:hypothetical protein